MIWHIFKKDFRLLWPFALAIAILPFAIVAVHLKMDHFFAENDTLEALLMLLELMLYFGAASLTAVAVHHDSLADVRQDWLARPIRRRDLLAAKLLFVLLAAQLPLLLANLACGLIDRFAFFSTLSASITEDLYFFLGFMLPVFAFVSLTRNLTEALGGAFALFIGVMGLEMLLAATNGGSVLGPTAGTGVAWIPQTERLLIYLLAASAILGSQYFRRATRVSRYVLAGAIVLCALTQVAPWRYAFGFEKALSAAPAADPSIHFDPALGRYHSPVSAETQSSATQLDTQNLRVPQKGAEIYFPVEVSGVDRGSILKIDSASVHLLGAHGKHESVINIAGDPGGFEVPNDGAADSAPVTHFEPVQIRSSIYNRIKNTPVTLQIDYSETALRLASTASLPAIGANQRVPGVGWCQSQFNDDKTAVEVRCLAAGHLPQCSTILLENPATRAQNPAIHGCLDDYSPYFGRYKPPDLITREGANLYFRDTAGLLHYPVDAAQIARSRVLLKSYGVAAHFSQQLTIPAIRLVDWSAP